MTQHLNATHVAALQDLRQGVAMDRHNLDDGDAKLAAIDAAVAALSGPLGHEAGGPFMYGITGPDGKAHFEEFCVSASREELQTEVVEHLNQDHPEDGPYSVVALFRDAAPQASADARKLPHIKQPLTLAQIEAEYASHDYSAELLLQHALLLLRQPQASAMPALNDAMRAVISNEQDVYQTPDALYGALCDAARDADKEHGNG